jgi:hypothetical protein
VSKTGQILFDVGYTWEEIDALKASGATRTG